MLELFPIGPAVIGLAAASFLAGAACIGLAVFLFTRKKVPAVMGVPAWAPALALGALLTFIVPGCLAFLLFYVLVSPTPPPPPPTCYAPKPPTCYAVGPSAIAGLALGRGELLERLHEEGRIPDHVYRRVKGR